MLGSSLSGFNIELLICIWDALKLISTLEKNCFQSCAVVKLGKTTRSENLMNIFRDAQGSFIRRSVNWYDVELVEDSSSSPEIYRRCSHLAILPSPRTAEDWTKFFSRVNWSASQMKTNSRSLKPPGADPSIGSSPTSATTVNWFENLKTTFSTPVQCLNLCQL